MVDDGQYNPELSGEHGCNCAKNGIQRISSKEDFCSLLSSKESPTMGLLNSVLDLKLDQNLKIPCQDTRPVIGLQIPNS